jgi:hypothetical protein
MLLQFLGTERIPESLYLAQEEALEMRGERMDGVEEWYNCWVHLYLALRSFSISAGSIHFFHLDNWLYLLSLLNVHRASPCTKSFEEKKGN